MWASIAKKAPSTPPKAAPKGIPPAPIKSKTSMSRTQVSITPEDFAFAMRVGAYWGDINDFNENEDGSSKEFFLESARKRAAVEKQQEMDESEKENLKNEQAEQARLDKIQAKEERLKKEEEEKEQRNNAPLEQPSDLCKCGCGRPIHKDPRPDFVGYCCGWCKKHKGKRGHGEGCGK